ncbi:MAG: MFS transporter [Eubacterium sp.]
MKKISKLVYNYFHTEGGILGAKEYLNYGFCGLGQNLIYGLMSSYLMYFYTDVFVVPAATVGTMFLVTKIWDAVNDPIMGIFVDKTRTKYGKMRPYFLFVPIPIAISTILLFTAPDLSENGKVIYMYVTYILWGMLYTVGDVPFWSMSSVLTTSQKERTNLVSFTRLMTGIGMGIPTILISLLSILQSNNIMTSITGDNKKMYFAVAVLMSVAGAFLLSRGFFGTKEVVQPSDEKPSFKDGILALVKNKPLLMVVLSNLLQFPRLIQTGALIYVANYIFGGNEWVLILGIPGTIAGFLGFVLVPPLVKKFGTIKSFILVNICWMIPTGLMFIIRPENVKQPVNLVLIFALLFISSFAASVIGILPTLLIAECVDFAEWKTGIRSEGVSFSTQTFMAKAQSALQSYTIGLLLVAFSFIQPKADAAGVMVQQVQSAATLNGIWAMYTIIPAVSYIFCIIPLFFYEIKGETAKKMQKELEERRKEINA